MSDIRFNQWLHNSGTGGVSQVDGGHVGIGTTNPLIPVGAGVTAILNVGVVTANSYYGDGSNLSGIVGGGTSLSFNDNIGAYFGNSQDLKIYHDGNHSYVDDQGTGNLRLRSGTLEIQNLAGNKTSAVFSSGGAQTLNFNNNPKFATQTNGITVTGGVYSDGLICGDSDQIELGDSGDLSIYHNGSNGYIKNSTGQQLYRSATHTFENAAGNSEYLRIDSSGRLLLNTSTTYSSNQIMIVKGASPTAGGNGPYDGQLAIECTETNGGDDTGGVLSFIGHDGNIARGFGSIRCLKENSTSGNYGSYMRFETRTNGSAPAERLRIHSSGQMQIGGTTLINSDPFLTLGQGTSGTGTMLHLVNNGTADLKQSFISAGKASRAMGIDVSTNNFFIGRDTSDQDIVISSTGKVGINYSSPSWMLEVHNPNPNNDSKQQIQRWINEGQNTLELNMYGGNVDQCQFAATNAEQTISFLTGRNTGSQVVSTETSLLMTQNRDLWNQGPDSSVYGGGLFIGRSASPYSTLCALRDSNYRPIIYLAGKYPEITLAHEVPTNSNHAAGIRFATYVQSTNTATGNQFVIGTNGPGTYLDIGHAVAAQNQNVHAGISNHSGTTRFRVTTSGCQVFGSFSKSSGSFKIPHPLPEKTETHELVHSFIEGPQADLIYRGVVDLVDGTATVNVDTAGRMTQGTFVALCTNVSCFTSNETDWTAVKGSISGNILTITAQDNTSTATVSWMVVGERKDQHMKDTNWTDDNGRVITEPLKSS